MKNKILISFQAMPWQQLMVALVICVAAAGCASTLTFPIYQNNSSAASGQTKSHDGITVTVDPFLDRERCNQYFGFFQEDVLIIHISARNTTSDRSFHLLKKNIRLQVAPIGAGRQVLEEEKIGPSTADADIQMAFGMIPGSLFGSISFAVGMQKVANQTAVREHLVNQELQEGTISPGQTLEGFVYCRLDNKHLKIKDGKIIVSMIEASSDNKIDFAFEINR